MVRASRRNTISPRPGAGGAEGEPSPRLFVYRAFGLLIGSELELPELAPAHGDSYDITFRLRPVKQPSPSGDAPSFEFRPDRQILTWPSVATFLIRGDSLVDIDPAPGTDSDLLSLPLLGPVIALLLHRRGLLVLHASAVGIGDTSAVFLGDKQAGKSTTAAALVARRHRLLTDDVLAIDFPSAGPRLLPGFPQMKLDAKAARTLLGARQDIGLRSIAFTDKQRLHFADPFLQDAVAPGRIYVLAVGSKPQAIALSPQDAFAAILRFSYIGRFGSGALDARSATAHLNHCAELARSVPVYRLEIPQDLDQLGEVLAIVEAGLE